MRGRFVTSAVVEVDSLEAHTAAILDAIPIEAQAQDLNNKVAEEFKQAREKVEDWLETHTQTNYKVFIYFVYFFAFCLCVI